MTLAPIPLAPRASDRCHEALRRRILTLDLAPGVKLDEFEIARAHGVSRTPAREAILALAQEGWVCVRPQAGTFVALFDAAILPERAEARRVLEELMARRAAERGADPALFRDALAAGRDAARTEDAEAFLAADHAFHAALAQAAEAPHLGTLARRERDALDRLRRLAPAPPGRLKRACDEHEAIVAEIARGDAKPAAKAMRKHLAARRDDIAALARVHPDWFAGAEPTARAVASGAQT